MSTPCHPDVQRSRQPRLAFLLRVDPICAHCDHPLSDSLSGGGVCCHHAAGGAQSMAVLASVSVAVLHEVDDGAPSDCSSSAYSSPARGLEHCGSPARQGAAEGRQPGPQQAATRTGPRATHRVPSYHLSNGSKRASTAWHRAPRPLNTTRPSPRAPLDDRVYRPGRPPSPHAKPRNLRRDERISRNGRKVRAPPTRLPP